MSPVKYHSSLLYLTEPSPHPKSPCGVQRSLDKQKPEHSILPLPHFDIKSNSLTPPFFMPALVSPRSFPSPICSVHSSSKQLTIAWLSLGTKTGHQWQTKEAVSFKLSLAKPLKLLDLLARAENYLHCCLYWVWSPQGDTPLSMALKAFSESFNYGVVYPMSSSLRTNCY